MKVRSTTVIKRQYGKNTTFPKMQRGTRDHLVQSLQALGYHLYPSTGISPSETRRRKVTLQILQIRLFFYHHVQCAVFSTYRGP